MAWNGKDRDVITAAKENGCLFSKRRKTYIFAAFSNSGAREAFKTDLGQIAGILFENWPHDDENLYVVRVVPA